MKSEEMMLGDWISFNGESVKVQQIVSGINEFDYDPIPLTEKILEKNGFTHRNADKILTKQSWTCECGGCTIHAKYNFGFLYFNIYGKPLKSNMFVPHAIMHIHYVHELQHILKDCRIDKEIVL